MKELLKNQLPKIIYGLFGIFAVCIFFGLLIGILSLIAYTHGIIQVVVIIITILIVAWIIGNEHY